MRGKALMLSILVLAGCGSRPHRPPPPPFTAFETLPVSGSLADARRHGFNECVERGTGGLRCIRHGVTLEGSGPYEAAVDLVGTDGGGGFDELTLWHGADQYALLKVAEALDAKGWKKCGTGTDEKGDQIIYTRQGLDVRISMDISYYGKRRLRIIPGWNIKEQRC